MQLIYRGQTSNYTPAQPSTYRKPHALNWRYQIGGESYSALPSSVIYHQPRAINWHYQIQA